MEDAASQAERGEKQVFADYGGQHIPQREQRDRPGDPRRSLQPEPNPPHHYPTAKEKRPRYGVSQYQGSDCVQSLGPAEKN